MNSVSIAVIAAASLLAGCAEPPPIMATDVPAATARPATGLDLRLIEWCRDQPDSSEERCRCWPAALRAAGFAEPDLRELLIRLGGVAGASGNRPLPEGYESATLSCGLWEPIGALSG